MEMELKLIRPFDIRLVSYDSIKTLEYFGDPPKCKTRFLYQKGRNGSMVVDCKGTGHGEDVMIGDVIPASHLIGQYFVPYAGPSFCECAGVVDKKIDDLEVGEVFSYINDKDEDEYGVFLENDFIWLEGQSRPFDWSNPGTELDYDTKVKTYPAITPLALGADPAGFFELLYIISKTIDTGDSIDHFIPVLQSLFRENPFLIPKKYRN